MLDKFRIFMDAFGKITVGVLVSAAVFLTVFAGVNEGIPIRLLWQILLTSFICSLGILIFPSGMKKEISKRSMLLRQVMFFVYINVAVLGMASYFDWFFESNPWMIVVMEICIVGVYEAFIVVSYLDDLSTARNMNQQLEKMKGGNKK